jgi:putative endonuclease
MAYFVYIMASQRHGTMYIGVTNNLIRRVYEHREKITPGFTSKYNVNRLVWFDQTDSIEAAIQHEKRLKHWQRAWKIEMIEKANPQWEDLYSSLLD